MKRSSILSLLWGGTSEQGASGKYKFSNRARSETLHNWNFNLAFWLRACLYFMHSEYFQQVLYSLYMLADGSCWSALQLYSLWSSPVEQMWLCHFTRAKGGLQRCQHAGAAAQWDQTLQTWHLRLAEQATNGQTGGCDGQTALLTGCFWKLLYQHGRINHQQLLIFSSKFSLPDSCHIDFQCILKSSIFREG